MYTPPPHFAYIDILLSVFADLQLIFIYLLIILLLLIHFRICVWSFVYRYHLTKKIYQNKEL